MQKQRNIVIMLVAAIALTILPAAAQGKDDKKTMDIPVCSRSFGTLAVVDHREGGQWWTSSELSLSPPSALINDFVRQSGCFDLVDRSTAFMVAEEERKRFADGMLRPETNVGLGQIIPADYIMVAALVGQNATEFHQQDFEGIMDILPLPDRVGRIRRLIPHIDISKKTADVVLSVVDTRSSAIVATMQGHGTKTDVGVKILVNGDAAGISRYSKTDIGRVIAKAYLNAYINITEQFSRLPKNASANSPMQAVEVTRPARLLVSPKDMSQTVRSLDVGMLLYPTGNREGNMWEVKDELGYFGWVLAESFKLAGRGSPEIIPVYEDNYESQPDFEGDSEDWEELR